MEFILNYPGGKMVNTWKVVAIIAIVLLIFETALIVYFYTIGNEMIENEESCAMITCAGGNYDSYQYDIYSKMCYCFDDNGEIGLQKSYNG